MTWQRMMACGLSCVLLASTASLWATNPPAESPLPDIGSDQPPSDQPPGMETGPRRIFPPNIDAAAAGKEAIRLYDKDKDGKISGKELDKCPGLKSAIDNLDPSGKEEITAQKIAARIKKWQDSKLGRMSLGCRVTHNGKPLDGAEVRFVPEKYLGKGLKIAKGKTDANGMVMLSVPQKTTGQFRDPPGVAPGLYRVEISKEGEKIPAKYNTQTVFGQEVAMDAKGIQEGIKFDLKY
jgi:hypothetical protein